MMLRKWIHRAIVAYLKRVGAFHTFPYGESGRYVVLMNEQQYHYYATLAQDMTPQHYHAIVWAARDAGVRVP